MYSQEINLLLAKLNTPLPNSRLKCSKLLLNKLSNEELKNWKLSINTSLLPGLKFIYFASLYRMTFIFMTIKLSKFLHIKKCVLYFLDCETLGNFLVQTSIDIAISAFYISVFPGDMTMISYFNIVFNKNVIKSQHFFEL